MFHVYFLRSEKNNKVYTGVTSKDPKIRLQEHNSGMNQFTKNNRPFVLCFYESYICEKDARKRELFYKSGIGRKIRDGILDAVSARG